MKRILLLAAVHALIINQVQKNAKGRKKITAPPSTISQKADITLSAEQNNPGKANYLTANYFYNSSNRLRKSFSLRQ